MNDLRGSGLLLRALQVVVMAATVAVGLGMGCATAVSVPAATEKAGEGVPAVAIGPGDEVEVKFYYTPDLNVTQTVRPDGRIVFGLVGEVQAAGLTPPELQQQLKELYAAHLVDPDITVLLRSQYTRFVLVAGEVRRRWPTGVSAAAPTPVMVPLPAPNRLTVEDALVMAGGYEPSTAELANVLIIRHQEGKRIVRSVDLRPSFGQAEAPEEGIEPVYLQPGDIVYVPETRIVQVDRWVEQHINRVIPDVGLFVSTVTGTTTVGYVSE